MRRLNRPRTIGFVTGSGKGRGDPRSGTTV